VWTVCSLKILTLTLLFLTVPSTHAASKNASGLRVRNRVASDDTTIAGAQICQGAVPSNVNLGSIGLSSGNLNGGVGCIAEDFDGNGSLDFMLYGAYIKAEGRRYSLIIFYEGPSVIRTQMIPEALEIFKSTDSERSNYPKYKNVVGLIKHAQGDRGIVYFINQKSGKFKKVPYVYPKGYEMGD
jgi:hypothetical protein